MIDKHPNDNAACKSDEHNKHLCYFVSYGYHVDNKQDYKKLVEDPKYQCYFCGRTAHSKESLCQPMEL